MLTASYLTAAFVVIGVMGWYQTVSMLLNADRYPVTEGTQPELKPLH